MGICSSCDSEPSHCHQPVRTCHNGYIFRNDTCGNPAEYYDPPSSFQSDRTNYPPSHQNYNETNRVPINPYFTSNRNYWE